MKNKNKGSLSEQLNGDLLKQLQDKKSTLKQQEKEREEKERQKKVKEREEREANKSFEELLNESELDWKKFKR
ncbi:sulfurtransferase [Halobacillus andaensis]|uniref:Sulfurtransferase n=1 Tax=Halobacillus andaensis TaxID=1176239 RepID=A0A917EUT1_HALAA|nr:YqkE family protein [Halobacillus andaensis]MBP2003195.1 5'-deoxynucleotidase YfbR-like HD superfamily hydrolase [Halobacillus andaensis]GGF08757.1 sulfurtransferase [Halobacillus andaensis]